jgi:predicted ABC-type ATPase
MLTKEDLDVESRSLSYAKKNRTSICRKLTDKNLYLAEECPVSVFMSGSPGAGKTEFSTDLVTRLEKNGIKILRLDPDDLRSEFEEYNGSNSFLFQRAVSLLVERSLDYIYKNKQSFLLDGTFASYKVAEKNIQRSLDKGRDVLVLFVYQRPELAWQFVEAREKVEGRKIKGEHFVLQFFGSQKVIQDLKEKFGKKIKVDIILKDNDGKTKNHHSNVDSLVPYLKPSMAKDEVEKIVGLR